MTEYGRSGCQMMPWKAGERGGDLERQTVLNLFKPWDFRITFGE